MQESFEFEKPSDSKSECKRKCTDFSEDSTCSGILYLLKSDRSLATRILWGVVVLVAVAGFGAVTIYDFVMLAREPISTSITLTREGKLNFPAVTICSLSFLNTTTLESTDAGESVTRKLIDLFDEVRSNSNIPGCQSIARELSDNTGFNGNFGELTAVTKNELTTLLLNCTFRGSQCSADDFEAISTIGGICYTFNGQSTQPIRTAQGTGVRQGLRLQLSPDDQLFSLGSDHGFRIVIHNPDEFPRTESEGITVPLQHTVYIGMRQVNSNDETKFSSGHQCRGEDYTDRNLDIPPVTPYRTYSPSVCQTECFYKHLANQCRCIEPSLFTPLSSPYNQFRPCQLSDLCCEVQAFDEVEESCDCPPKCETVERTTTVSYSTNADDNVGVNVFYESLILETRETEDSYTPWGLISDIGGNTGLFLGFTLLTGVEFLMLMVELIKSCCCGGCKKSTMGAKAI